MKKRNILVLLLSICASGSQLIAQPREARDADTAEFRSPLTQSLDGIPEVLQRAEAYFDSPGAAQEPVPVPPAPQDNSVKAAGPLLSKSEFESFAEDAAGQALTVY